MTSSYGGGRGRHTGRPVNETTSPSTGWTSSSTPATSPTAPDWHTINEPAPAPTPTPVPPVPAPPDPVLDLPASSNLGFGDLGVQVNTPNVGKPRYEFNKFAAQWDRNGKPTMYYWELIVYDVRGGLNKTYGDYDQDFDRISSGSLWVDERELVLPPLNVAATSPDPGGDLAGMHHIRFGGRLLILCGSTDDLCFFRTTSATDPTIEAVTGAGTAARPGSAHTCAELVVMNGATTAQSWIEGRAGAAPRRISDINGTVAATGHANLNPTWGLTQYNDIILYYANNGLWTHSITNEISDAPTQVQANLPDGGWVLGLQRLAAGIYNSVRTFIAMPETDTTAGGLLFGTEKTFKIWHCIPNGLDLVPMSFEPILNKVTWACLYKEGILATDGERWAYHNGGFVADLYQYEDREADSDREYRTRAGWVIGHQFFPRVNQVAISGGSSVTKRWIERFDYDNWAFTPGSEQKSMGSTGLYGVLPGARGLPWDDNTKTMFSYEDGAWNYQKWPEPGVKWFSKRKTTGSAATTGLQSATTGTYTSPLFRLPGMEGPKVLARVTHLGQNKDSGTPTTQGTITVTIPGGRTIPFKPSGTANISVVWTLPPDQQDVFDLFQWSCTVTQQTGGTDPTRTNINVLPLKFEGFWWPEKDLLPPPRPMLRGR